MIARSLVVARSWLASSLAGAFWWTLGVYVGATTAWAIAACFRNGGPESLERAFAAQVALASIGGVAAAELRSWRARVPLVGLAIASFEFWRNLY